MVWGSGGVLPMALILPGDALAMDVSWFGK